mgnify:CR=1 FL=1
MRKLTIIILTQIILISSGISATLESIDSLKIIVENTESNEKVHALITLSEAYRNIVFSDCINYGKQAYNLAVNLKNPELEALTLKSLGTSNYYTGYLDTAFYYFHASLDIYKETGNKPGQAKLLNNIGLIYEERAEFNKAKDMYNQSLELEEKIGNSEGVGVSLIQIGNICYYSKNYYDALENYFLAASTFTEINNTDGIAYSYNSIGIIYAKLGKYIEAVSYYEKSISLFTKSDNKRALSQTLTNLGELYNYQYKDYKKALSVYNKALQLKKSQNDKIGIALLNNNLGTLYINMEDYINANEHLQYSLELYEDLNSHNGIVMVYYNLGHMYQIFDSIEKAIYYFKESLYQAKIDGQVEYIEKSQESLLHCFALTCNYDEFQNYFRLYKFTKDTLIEKLNEFKLSKLEIEHQIAENIEKNNQLEQDNKIKERELSRYKFILMIISGLIIIVLFVYLLFLKSRKK